MHFHYVIMYDKSVDLQVPTDLLMRWCCVSTVCTSRQCVDHVQCLGLASGTQWVATSGQCAVLSRIFRQIPLASLVFELNQGTIPNNCLGPIHGSIVSWFIYLSYLIVQAHKVLLRIINALLEVAAFQQTAFLGSFRFFNSSSPNRICPIFWLWDSGNEEFSTSIFKHFLLWACFRDAWSRLGAMSQETAMAAYVEEMKKVAREVQSAFFHVRFHRSLL